MDTYKSNIAIAPAATAGDKTSASDMTDVQKPSDTFEGSDRTNSEADIRQLEILVEQLRENEVEAQRRNSLLEALIEHLPVSISVQDEHGRCVFINGAAAIQETSEELDLANNVIEAEENISGPAGERTLLTRRKPMRILDQTLLLSTSLDI